MKKSFTLIEVIITIVVLGVLASIAVPRFIKLSKEGNGNALSGIGKHFVDDAPLVSQYHWCAVKWHDLFYAIANIKSNGRHTTIKMHRLILGLNSPLVQVDHRDGNGLNNCRINLRLATDAQNQMNRRLAQGSQSGFKGVVPSGKKWEAHIKQDGRSIYLGVFSTKDLAAQAYNRAANERFGAFAKLNKLGES